MTPVQHVAIVDQQSQIVIRGAYLWSISNTLHSLRQAKVTYLQPAAVRINENIFRLNVAMN